MTTVFKIYSVVAHLLTHFSNLKFVNLPLAKQDIQRKSLGKILELTKVIKSKKHKRPSLISG